MVNMNIIFNLGNKVIINSKSLYLIVGHSHPKIAEVAYNQLKTLNTNSRFLHDNLVMYAERLTNLLPPPLSVCFFVNSGSEANDLALRLARTYTKRKETIVLDQYVLLFNSFLTFDHQYLFNNILCFFIDSAYHGHVISLIDVSPYKFAHPGGEGQPDWVHVVSLLSNDQKCLSSSLISTI